MISVIATSIVWLIILFIILWQVYRIVSKYYINMEYDLKKTMLCKRFIKKKAKDKDFFSKELVEMGFSHVAIYGYGDIAKIMIDDLTQSATITIDYIIDRGTCDVSGFKVYGLESDLPETDAIIISIVKDRNTAFESLRKIYTGRLVFVDDLF